MADVRAHNHRTRRAPRGTVYIAVLALAMLALVLGLGGMMASRVRARQAALASESSEARLYARSAIEMGRAWIAADSAWRSNRGAGGWINAAKFGDGTISLDVTSTLGALNRSTLDPVVLVATGVKGGARQKLKVTLSPDPEPLSSIGPAWCAGGSISVAKVVTGPGLTLATNADFVINSPGSVNADVEASGTATGSSYGGSKRTGVAPRSMPSIATAVAEYTLLGSTGSFATIPKVSGSWTLKSQLISPASAPFGCSARANGVYVLDCGGKPLVMQDLRVVGTIVLVNCGGLSLNGAINWAPAVVGYPCLVVQGSVTIDADAAALTEASVSVNFNPSTTPFPYPSGTSNATSTDYYPCAINGLLYASGGITINNKGWSCGPMVTNATIDCKEAMTLVPCPEYKSHPAPGLAKVNMSPALWEQAVD